VPHFRAGESNAGQQRRVVPKNRYVLEADVDGADVDSFRSSRVTLTLAAVTVV